MKRLLRDLDTSCPILILKANRGVVHHGSVGVCRTLGRLGVSVYAIVDDGHAPLANSRYITKSFVWHRWPATPDAFLRAVSAVAGVIGRPAVLFPMDDLSAITVAENAKALAKWFLLPRLPSHLPRQLANKAVCYSLCSRAGIPAPRSLIAMSIEDVLQFAEDSGLPIVLKAIDQWQLIAGRFSVKIIKNPKELSGFSNYFRDDFQPMLLQEYIPGEDWIAHGYYNIDEHLLVTFTGKKLLAYPADAGSTAMGLSLNNETLRCQAEKFLKAVGYSGIIDMDWRKDERDGQYKMFDCNPRVGNNFRMFENTGAIDVVRSMYLDLTCQRIDRAPMIEGKLFIAESFCSQSFFRGQQRRAMRPDISIVRREFAWWSGDDIQPFMMMTVRLLHLTFLRAFRRARGFCSLVFHRLLPSAEGSARGTPAE